LWSGYVRLQGLSLPCDSRVRDLVSGHRFPRGVVKLSLAMAAVDARRRTVVAQDSGSCAHSTKGDVAPGSVCLGADLSVGGGGQAVSTWTEMVRDSAERAEKALRVLG
jgi:hypothetical protein